MRRLDGDAVVQRCSPATTAETADSYAAEAEIACCFGKVIRIEGLIYALELSSSNLQVLLNYFRCLQI
jgi:hypothetical protein